MTRSLRNSRRILPLPAQEVCGNGGSLSFEIQIFDDGAGLLIALATSTQSKDVVGFNLDEDGLDELIAKLRQVKARVDELKGDKILRTLGLE